LLFTFDLEYAVRKVRKNEVCLEFKWSYDLLICADDINLLGCNINNIEENTETLFEANRIVDLEINTEKYMIMPRHQNSGQNQNFNVGNELFEDVAKFNYLGTTLKNYNIYNEMMSRWNSWNVPRYSDQIFVFPSNMKDKLKIKIY
jgi:hypothetical protein